MPRRAARHAAPRRASAAPRAPVYCRAAAAVCAAAVTFDAAIKMLADASATAAADAAIIATFSPLRRHFLSSLCRRLIFAADYAAICAIFAAFAADFR